MPWPGTFLYLQGVCFYFCVLSLSWAVSHAFLSNSVICSKDQICPRKHLESHSVFQEKVLNPWICQGCGEQLLPPDSNSQPQALLSADRDCLAVFVWLYPLQNAHKQAGLLRGGVPSPVPRTS